jgi:hypothetical protein
MLLGLLTKVPALLGPITGALTGINFSAVGVFFALLWKNIVTYWRFWVPAILIITNVGFGLGWSHEHELLVKEQLAHKTDIQNFKTEQAVATAKAVAEKSVLQKESKANADQADANYTNLYSQYRSVLLRYQANQSGAGSTDNHQLPSAQSGNGPGTSSEVSPAGTITITMDDANVCAINTARLQAVHDWAINPPKDGTANDEN